MKRIITLPLNFEFGEIKLTVFPTVIQDESEVVLVDCGYPHFKYQIEEAMKKEGLSLSMVTKIIITHSDHDHMGALKEIISEYPNIEVMASEKQIPYITGREKSLRLIQAQENHANLDAKGKIENEQFMDMIASVGKIQKVTGLSDKEIIPVCGGIEVIDTSGHMPGHISLYLKEEKTLIAGDALDVWQGKLGMSMPQFMLDMDMALKSVEKFLDYDIEKIICYHGGTYTGDIEGSVKKVLQVNK